MTLSAGLKAFAWAYLHDGGWPPVCCLCCDVSHHAIRLPPEHFGLGHNFSCVPKHAPAGTESSPVKEWPLVPYASGRSCDGLETGQAQLSLLCWLLLGTTDCSVTECTQPGRVLWRLPCDSLHCFHGAEVTPGPLLEHTKVPGTLLSFLQDLWLCLGPGPLWVHSLPDQLDHGLQVQLASTAAAWQVAFCCSHFV